MKRILLVLAAVLLISGAAWGQVVGPASPGLADNWREDPLDPTSARLPTVGELTEYDATLGLVSIAARRSYYAFFTDVDNFIDPVNFDRNIGTFYVIGAPPTGTAISLGYGKTLGEGDSANYIGIYYGGNLVNAGTGGYTVGDFSTATVVWQNNLAVLYGTPTFGIRVDLIMNNLTDTSQWVDGSLAYQSSGEGPTLAIRFGTTIGEDMPFWAKAGVTFPQTTIVTDATATVGANNSTTVFSGGSWGIAAGIESNLSETTLLITEAVIGGVLPGTVSGDGVGMYPESATYSAPFGIGLYAEYQKTIAFGSAVTVRLMPNAYLDFQTNDNKTTVNGTSGSSPSDNRFILEAGFNAGIEYKYEKVAIYSGLSLNLFNFAFYENDKNTEWTLTGINWASGTLQFGVTFEPVTNLVFGAGMGLGLNFNPATMTTGTNTATAPSQYGYSTALLNNLTLIISYKL